MKKWNGSKLCDHCRRIVNPYNKMIQGNLSRNDEFVVIISKNKKRELHFCNERCSLVYLKGKKYFQSKLKIMIENKIDTSKYFRS